MPKCTLILWLCLISCKISISAIAISTFWKYLFNDKCDPRKTLFFSIFCKFIADLLPISTSKTFSLWVCIDLIFTSSLIGSKVNLLLSLILPDNTVPVTTVPKPFLRKTLSTNILKIPLSNFDNGLLDKCIISFFKSSIPIFNKVETLIIFAFSKKLFFTNVLISLIISSNHSGSTKSILFIIIIPEFIFKIFKILKCSFVWGIIPSSAAITKIAQSIALTPETIFLINFSCPGTSIIEIWLFKCAKPISIVNPLFISSLRLSVFWPVKLFTIDVFPWSICPDNPNVNCFKSKPY